MSWVAFCFSLFPFAETSLLHLGHRIEHTDALDVVRDYYLFGSLKVWIQHSQWGQRALSHVPTGKRTSGKRTLWILLSHYICLTCKQPGVHPIRWHQKVSPFYTTTKRGSWVWKMRRP